MQTPARSAPGDRGGVREHRRGAPRRHDRLQRQTPGRDQQDVAEAGAGRRGVRAGRVRARSVDGQGRAHRRHAGLDGRRQGAARGVRLARSRRARAASARGPAPARRGAVGDRRLRDRARPHPTAGAVRGPGLPRSAPRAGRVRRARGRHDAARARRGAATLRVQPGTRAGARVPVREHRRGGVRALRRGRREPAPQPVDRRGGGARGPGALAGGDPRDDHPPGAAWSPRRGASAPAT